MCFHYRKISKQTDKNGVKFAYCPCGVCEECREAEKRSWCTRLALELQSLKSEGWQIGFLTLTYNETYKPILSPDVFVDPLNEWRAIPCFSRQDVSKYVKSIRHDLHRYYGVKGLRYMICSEYGSQGTKRPHYHAMFCWKNEGGLTSEKMFEMVSDKWKFGFTFPKKFNGGFDGKYEHKPFLVQGTTYNAANYASKYVCKDLNFVAELGDTKFKKDSKLFKYSMPFHIQSRSLGLSSILNKDDKTLMSLLRSGISLVGRDKRISLPVYLKRKIIFDPLYITDEVGNRLVRKKASSFLLRNYRDVFNLKSKAYDDLFAQMKSVDFWRIRKVENPEDVSSSVSRILNYASELCVGSLGSNYLATYGFDFHRPLDLSDLPKTWLSRYILDSSGKCDNKNLHKLKDNSCESDYFLVKQLNDCFSLALGFVSINPIDFDAKIKERELLDKVKDYFKES